MACPRPVRSYPVSEHIADIAALPKGANTGSAKQPVSSPQIDNAVSPNQKCYKFGMRSGCLAGGSGRDLAAAIQWVSDNIGRRGGDPARIYRTVFHKGRAFPGGEA
jgi:hypothetical protein